MTIKANTYTIDYNNGFYEGEKKMTEVKMYLNFNDQWEAGTYGVRPAEIYDEVKIQLPEGAKIVLNACDEEVIELASGEIVLITDIKTAHKGTTAVPYIVSTDGYESKIIYLKVVK